MGVGDAVLVGGIGGSGGGGSGVSELTAGTGITITNPSGPNATVGVTPNTYAPLAGVTFYSILTTGTVKGNGTTDDTSAINTIVGGATANSVIYFPGLTYLVSGTILVGDYITLMGIQSKATNASVASGGSVLTVAAGANLSAVIADVAWYNNATANNTCPAVIGMAVNGNAANQTSGTGIGIVMMSYRAQVVNCVSADTYGDGIRFTDTAKNGTAIVTGNCAECRVTGCVTDANGINNQANNNSGIAIRGASSLVTDGWCTDNTVSGPSSPYPLYGIFCNSASGWKIDGNHVYGTGSDGIHITGGSYTRVTDNYCEFWGQTNSTGAVYGIYVSGADGGTVIEGNNINMNQSGVTGNTFTGIAVYSPTGASSFAVGPNTISSTSTSGTGFATLGTDDNGYIVALSPQAVQGLTAPYSILPFITLIGDPFVGFQQPTYAGTMTLDLSLGTTIEITLTGNLTLNVPTNIYPGVRFSLIIVQDATGGRTVSYSNTGGAWKGTAWAPTATASAYSGATFLTDGYNVVHSA